MAYGILLLLLGGLLLANICMGSVTIPLEGIFRFIKGEALSQVEANILFQIRLPRALSAAILGGALGLSGYLLQTFFHNPIAGPFVLGISSGAKMVVALTMIVYLKYIGRFSYIYRPVCGDKEKGNRLSGRLTTDGILKCRFLSVKCPLCLFLFS